MPKEKKIIMGFPRHPRLISPIKDEMHGKVRVKGKRGPSKSVEPGLAGGRICPPISILPAYIVLFGIMFVHTTSLLLIAMHKIIRTGVIFCNPISLW
jgi:hypothetical protein